jgi:RNA polymerase sigma factor (sigma-70 family)
MFMHGDTGYASDIACRPIVRALIAQYDWALPREDELLARVSDAVRANAMPANLDRVAYSVALYEACRQSEDLSRREGAYQELFRFLYRAAYNKWPALADDVTQRALALVYEQIDRCQGSSTFLSFAFFKLRQALTEERRAQAKETPLDEIEPSAGDRLEDREEVEIRLNLEECLPILIDAIARLLDERQQKVLLLKYVEGLSDEEIGARLRITAGHVRVLRHRGLAKLRRDGRLKACFDGERV